MSAYDPLLQVELMVAAENPGTWHTNANNVFTQLAEAMTLRTTLTFSSADITLTDTAKASNQSRSGMLVLAGTLTANCNAIIPNRSKSYFVQVTATLGAFTLGMKTSAGTATKFPNQGLYFVICDGAADVTCVPLDGTNYAIADGTDTYTATCAFPVSTLRAGMEFTVYFTNANTGAATLNVNGIGAKSIVKNGSSAIAVGDIAAGMIGKLVYDGTNMQLLPAKVTSTLALSSGGVKTSSFNAAANTRYTTRGSGITATGPASPTQDDVIVLVVGANGIYFAPNGQKINGSTASLYLPAYGTYMITFDATDGWS